MATPDGRVTLFNTRLIITERGERTERLIESGDEYRAALSQYFDIDPGELKFKVELKGQTNVVVHAVTDNALEQ